MKLDPTYCREMLIRTQNLLYADDKNVRHYNKAEDWTDEQCVEKFQAMIDFVAFTKERSKK